MDVLTARAHRLAHLLMEDGIGISDHDAEMLVIAFELDQIRRHEDNVVLFPVPTTDDGPEVA